ncbi:hypothetical protein SAMN06265795_106212 [Noviherbaspirillum humi]|uniref:DUF2938 family protein n=1 Tax=Noviherbaspirillum humi TaxID=1688639 RepID=A0A239HH19_9BURK|nr:hypothetical protein [Noviherbaspirillum humi]SNS79554.1 hypothetical protein SAMN06265795_106212 [Noviherbaspirillum humi]
MKRRSHSWAQTLRDGLVSGAISSLTSTAALSVRGAMESGSLCAPVNAISRWVWGERAVAHDEPSLRHTLLGYGIHHASSTLWAVVYERWFGEVARRSGPGPALAAGMAVAGMACFTDYRLTPDRLEPGYDRRLTAPSVGLAYVAFGAGVALRSIWAAQRRSD